MVKKIKLSMSSHDNQGQKGGKGTFWKSNKSVPGSIRPVYGAQHPPILQSQPNRTVSSPSTPTKKRGGRDSFQAYEDKTIDAWDDGDDDLMVMANLSMADVQTSAMAVIHSHSQQKHSVSNNGAHNAGDNTHKAGGRKPVQEPSTHPSQSQHPHGPGVGIRLGNAAPSQKMVPFRMPNNKQDSRESQRLEKFRTVLAGPNTDLEELRTLSWSGIPRLVRHMTWKILSGYLPASTDRRELTLQRKRKEYFGFIEQYYHTRDSDGHKDTYRQIAIDIPRMNPLIPLFQQEVVQEIEKDVQRMASILQLSRHKVAQEIFQRVLFIWAIRHPASGYVQGMNDLVTPFFVVFLSEFIDNDIESENVDLSKLSTEMLNTIEADSFWCLSKLLDGIQDNYTFAQPGIQIKVNVLKELVKRIDVPLYKHLEDHNVEFLQFAFRWMNNLLMREMTLKCCIRLWDTYQAEPDGFASFHLYVCAAFLCRFSDDIRKERDFQGIMMFLQNLPTHHWTNEDIGLLLAEAYKLKFMYADAPNHFKKQ